MKKGFTLAEILVVLAVLSLIGVLVVTIFTRSLRGANKSQILSSIKQNGQVVLENIDKTVRSSDNVVCSEDTLVVVQNGIYTRYGFIPPLNANGFIQQDNPVKENVEGSIPLREETDPEFVNRVCLSTDPMLEPVILTDRNPQTGVSVEVREGKKLFTRNRSAGFRDQITINFDLKPGVEAPQVIVGQIDPVVFQTTIQLR